MGWLLLSSNLFAQKAIEIKVWPDGAPNTNEMTQQVKDGPLYVEEPVLTVYPAKNGNGMAIVACPGGAYWTLAMGHEGHDMADWFNSQGITYAVLRYRMPNGHNEVPLSDSQQALRIMRQHAQEWNVKNWASWALLPEDIWPAPQPLISPMRKLARISRFFSTRSSPWTLLTLIEVLTTTCWERIPQRNWNRNIPMNCRLLRKHPLPSFCTAAMTR